MPSEPSASQTRRDDIEETPIVTPETVNDIVPEDDTETAVGAPSATQLTERRNIVDAECPKITIRFETNAPIEEGNAEQHAPVDPDYPYGEMDDYEVVFDQEDKEWVLPENAFVVDGYRFVRWSTTKDGKDVKDDETTPDVNESFVARPVEDKTKFKGLRYEWKHETTNEDGSKQLKTEQYDLTYAKKTEQAISESGEPIDRAVVTLYAQWEKNPAEAEKPDDSPEDNAPASQVAGSNNPSDDDF